MASQREGARPNLICHSSFSGMGDRRGARRDLSEDEDDVDNGEHTKLDVVEHAEGALDDLCSDSFTAADIEVQSWWLCQTCKPQTNCL